MSEIDVDKRYPSHAHNYGTGKCPICGVNGVESATPTAQRTSDQAWPLRWVNFDLYEGSRRCTVNASYPLQAGYQLYRLIDSSNTLRQYDVELILDQDGGVPGWTNARTRLIIDGVHWSDYKPLSWYEHEPTDWPTGLARFTWDFESEKAPGIPTTYLLAVRRPS